eukprot:5240350-Amphidinium_carterae.1
MTLSLSNRTTQNNSATHVLSWQLWRECGRQGSTSIEFCLLFKLKSRPQPFGGLWLESQEWIHPQGQIDAATQLAKVLIATQTQGGSLRENMPV